ncbi:MULTISPECIES: YjcZ family sporulation protein [Bacillus]|nr:YjcZ family sporulation protein [Bacillus mycoides]MCQ6534651.1 YjcZ family sporulation protein [Bacillus mycoides]MDR4300641.1 YjcZ family sporulation protein [Bacillus mycoides]QWI13557.1 YjcZ family sporulation protein [Bacillus mycoides]QWI52930.1 YjcZ family sporulation protein [Bacillus mycoides]QWI89567.1 YjcZ family sporulation protein [Bacillus mycoides]
MGYGGSCGFAGGFVLFVVLFILLIIIGCSCFC